MIFFFLAFLPHFLIPGAGSVILQLFWLGLLFTLATLVSFGSIACFAAVLACGLLRSPGMQTGLNRLSVMVFLGLAARLAVVKA